MNQVQRCPWPGQDTQMVMYHDKEWGTPFHNEKRHYEFLLLEFFQAGLSWSTILHKRENFRMAFDGFDYKLIARYDATKVSQLMQNAGIIRNRRKIEAAIHNARMFMNLQAEFGSFDSYIWSFTNGKPIVNNWNSFEQIPVTTSLSDTVSKDLKQHGFKFVGSTTIYAHLQAIGVVNDHLVSCFRHAECQAEHN